MANPSHDLLPCPFCGGAARIESNRDWHRIYAAHDDECVFDADDHALMYPAQPGYLIQIAEDWNRRSTPPLPSTAPEVGELKPYAYEYGRPNGDGTYSVVIERGDIVQVGERKYDYAPPAKAVKDWPVTPLYRRAALASRPAEVDDEGLPPMPRPTFVHETICTGVKSSYFTAEQYRQGQRDAVAADRARREKGGA